MVDVACVAALTDRGRCPTNEDACCVEVAQTVFGEVALAVVCDGVGGLDEGDVASSTVVRGLVGWFEGELPCLMGEMARDHGGFDPLAVRVAWVALLGRLNDLMHAPDGALGKLRGTTFTGVLACDGTYVLGHVGDSRAYLLGRTGLRLLTHDQVAGRQGTGTGLDPRAAGGGRALLQAVGAVETLEPVLSVGDLGPGELLLVCSDGAWRKAGDAGIMRAFGTADPTDEAALERACRQLVRRDLELGERDNLTVACLSLGPGGRRGEVPTVVCDEDSEGVATEVLGGVA